MRRPNSLAESVALISCSARGRLGPVQLASQLKPADAQSMLSVLGSNPNTAAKPHVGHNADYVLGFDSALEGTLQASLYCEYSRVFLRCCSLRVRWWPTILRLRETIRAQTHRSPQLAWHGMAPSLTVRLTPCVDPLIYRCGSRAGTGVHDEVRGAAATNKCAKTAAA